MNCSMMRCWEWKQDVGQELCIKHIYATIVRINFNSKNKLQMVNNQKLPQI